MQFARPIWLVAGVLACAMAVFGFYYFQKKGREALRRFVAGELLERLIDTVSPGRRTAKRILLIAAVASIFAALARPQAGYRWEEVKRRGIDILMAVDTSKSMLANDVRPNRLERSKLGIVDFVSRLEGDRVGLIPFAGSAFLMCPLTLDYGAFRQSLNALDTEIIPRGGTDIASAIREAESAFSGSDNHKILILLTDGEDLEGGAVEVAKEAAAGGMTIYTVGVGTRAGELIPLPGKGRFVKDPSGRVVKSRLDEETLRRIATVSGGEYQPLGRQAEGLDKIYRRKLGLIPKHEISERMKRVPVDRFQWPLALAFILLVAEFVVSDRKFRPRKASLPTVVQGAGTRVLKRMKGAGRAAALVLILVAMSGAWHKAWASPGGGEKAYATGDYSRAAREYRETVGKTPDDAELRFNLGATAYKEKKYDEALRAFHAALKSPDIPLQNRAYYNMGNTLFRQGQRVEKSKPRETLRLWEESIKAYEGALKLRPDDKDARFNRDYVKKRVEALKKRQGRKQDKKRDSKSCRADAGKKNNDKKKGDGKDGKKGKGDGKQADNRRKHGNGAGKNGPGKEQKAKGNTGLERAGKDRKEMKNPPPKGSAAEKRKPSKQARTARGRAPGKAGTRRTPGRMTQEQARNLLDSLKGEEAAPMVAGRAENQRAYGDETRRDW